MTERSDFFDAECRMSSSFSFDCTLISVSCHLMGKSEKLSFGCISYIFQFYLSGDVSFQGCSIIIVVCK